MAKVDEAAVGAARVVGRGTLIMGMLGTEAPPTGLPQGAFFDCMPWLISAAPEAVQELGFGSMSSLAQNRVALQVVLSRFYIGWSLSGEDVRDVLAARGKESGCGG